MEFKISICNKFYLANEIMLELLVVYSGTVKLVDVY